MEIAYLTGQRIGDVLALKRSAITEAGILFRQQKTGAELMVRMTPELSAAVERAKSVGGENIRALTLFHIRGRVPSYRGTRDLWERACAAAGVSDAGLHDLRSKALTDARQQGKDAQTLGGHTDARMTERYIRRREVPVADSPD